MWDRNKSFTEGKRGHKIKSREGKAVSVINIFADFSSIFRTKYLLFICHV
jgi:hypothetical protein